MRLLASSLLILILLYFVACSNPEQSAQQQLEQRGYSFTAAEFVEVAANGSDAILALFGKAGMDPNATDSEGNTALIAASEQGHERIVRMLLGAGADPKHCDAKGRNGLIGAAFGGHPTIVNLFRDQGVDISVEDKKGWTALAIAAYKGHVDVVRFLADSAAQKNLDDALQLASENGNPETLSVLRQLGARDNSSEDAILRSATMASDIPSERIIVSTHKPKPLAALNGSTIRNLRSKDRFVESLALSGYRKQNLPITFRGIVNQHAVFQLAGKDGRIQEVSVLKGSMIPETRYRLDKIELPQNSSRFGGERRVAMSRVKVQNVSTGANHLLVKNDGAGSADICGIVTTPHSAYRYVAKSGDVFQTVAANSVERQYQVVDVHPNGVVIKDLISEEGFTLPHISNN